MRRTRRGAGDTERDQALRVLFISQRVFTHSVTQGQFLGASTALVSVPNGREAHVITKGWEIWRGSTMNPQLGQQMSIKGPSGLGPEDADPSAAELPPAHTSLHTSVQGWRVQQRRPPATSPAGRCW